ncbi:large ribosomal subunit protein mL66-like [Artemia franciscana]|uniref:28S ribosomal protein S18a, mitochondrial n=1 Tax=Artemia franciscana TaxID=6661 RepID=A0AA88IEK1_ARTSF|nr:hypothetical protein QYM36_007496 [Artemia franciscana]
MCSKIFPFTSKLIPKVFQCSIAQSRAVQSSQISYLKKIEQEEKENKIVIKATYYDSDRVNNLLPQTAIHSENCGACPLCRIGIPVMHTDVLIISQFVNSKGGIMPRKVTGLCKRMQKRIDYLVPMAQRAGLLMNLTPDYSKKDPKRRRGWKRFNTYYDESTIKY